MLHGVSMRSIHAVRLITVAVVLMSLPLAARTQTDPDAVAFDRARTAFNHGDAASALAQVEALLTRSPENLNALYFSAVVNFQVGNVDAARGRIEHVVRLAGNYFEAWQLMVQVTQAQGDVVRRDAAIDRLKIAIKTANDPDIRNKAGFVRDRIRVGDQVLLAVDYFDRNGTDFTRYQFVLDGSAIYQERGLLLRTDTETTENWRTTALLAPDTQLFHLDLVDPTSAGEDKVAIYEFYVGEPDYDTVRAEVLKVLRGEVRPLSGEPGSLAGVLKP